MRSRRLVIDASVAGISEYPVSKANRDFLMEVRAVCHKVVMTPEISVEWQNHGTKFALGWQKSMMARRKLATLFVLHNSVLRVRIRQAQITPRQRRAMEKDAPLLEAALSADRIVISRDEEARGLYKALAADWPPLRDVLWLQPDESPTEALDWLRRGAKPTRKWQLGAMSSVVE